MPRGKKVTAEHIKGKLREAEVGLAHGKTVPEVVRKLGVTEQTYSRRKRERVSTASYGTSCWTAKSSTPSGKRRCSSVVGRRRTTPSARTTHWGTDPRPRSRAAPVRLVRLRLTKRTGESSCRCTMVIDTDSIHGGRFRTRNPATTHHGRTRPSNWCRVIKTSAHSG